MHCYCCCWSSSYRCSLVLLLAVLYCMPSSIRCLVVWKRLDFRRSNVLAPMTGEASRKRQRRQSTLTSFLIKPPSDDNNRTLVAESRSARPLPSKAEIDVLFPPQPTPLTTTGSSWYVHLPNFYTSSSFSDMFETHPNHRHELFVYGRPVLENRWSSLYVTPDNAEGSYRYSGATRTSIVCQDNTNAIMESMVMNLAHMANDSILPLLMDRGWVKTIPQVDAHL